MTTVVEQKALQELQAALGNSFDKFFPDGIDAQVEKETFQSETFQKAGFHTMPDRYGLGDRFLYTIRHPDGRITFVVVGKISSGNPFDVMHASIGGALDLRKDNTVVYQYDGRGKIVETQVGKRKRNTYESENGKPDVLLSYLRPTLGTPVQEPTNRDICQ